MKLIKVLLSLDAYRSCVFLEQATKCLLAFMVTIISSSLEFWADQVNAPCYDLGFFPLLLKWDQCWLFCLFQITRVILPFSDSIRPTSSHNLLAGNSACTSDFDPSQLNILWNTFPGSTNSDENLFSPGNIWNEERENQVWDPHSPASPISLFIFNNFSNSQIEPKRSFFFFLNPSLTKRNIQATILIFLFAHIFSSKPVFVISIGEEHSSLINWKKVWHIPKYFTLPKSAVLMEPVNW